MNLEVIPLLVTPREAARMLAVSPRKLWSMTFDDADGVPYVRCGRLVRYRPAALEAFAQRMEGKR